MVGCLVRVYRLVRCGLFGDMRNDGCPLLSLICVLMVHESVCHPSMQPHSSVLTVDPSMQPHSCYEMTAALAVDKASWSGRPQRLHAMIQTGNRFGMMIVRERCECCGGRYDETIFFTCDDGDSVLYEHMNMRVAACSTSTSDITLDTKLIVRLPDSSHGLFECRHTTPGFNDAYVLENLTHEMEGGSNAEYLFRVLHETIVKRSAFRNMYFRAFRKAFAPGNAQANKAVLQWRIL